MQPLVGGSNVKISAKLLTSSVGNKQPLEIITDRQVELGWINGGWSRGDGHVKCMQVKVTIVVTAMGEGEAS
jgi:hypothetical protein